LSHVMRGLKIDLGNGYSFRDVGDVGDRLSTESRGVDDAIFVLSQTPVVRI